jgi:RNA polymerase sigma-70 factor (ECF subfamily)
MTGTPRANEFDPEALVIDAIAAGDRYAFDEFVHRNGRWVRAVVFGVLGNRDAVDDVCQQVWAAVWRRIGELRDVTRWRPWLYRLARNAAYDAGRELARQSARAERHAAQISGWVGGSAVEAVAKEELYATVIHSIQALPAIYREPFVLRHVNGWNYQQIAEVMGMPVDTVETRLVRARRLLREALEGKIE